MSNLGYFDKNGAEYVVKEVNTVLPYVNYFWNNTWISGVSQHMAGIGCFTERPMQYMHPVTRALMVRDENRHFYVRDNDSGEFWAPGWYPVQKELDEYECRHGLGYSILTSTFKNIETKLRVFVPRNDPCEIWSITVKNNDSAKRNVSVFSFVDWLLTGYEEYCDYHSNLRGDFYEKENMLIAFNDTAEANHEFFNGFICSDIKPAGYDNSRSAFLNYGSMANPAAVVKGQCTNSFAANERLVGALQHTFDLMPGQEVTFHVLMGATSGYEFSAAIANKFNTTEKVEAELAATLDELSGYYNRVHFRTPEEKLNNLLNHWIKRSVQLHTEVGTDTGRGFRDVMQATWAMTAYDAQGAADKICDCLMHQFKDGHTLRGWNPVDDHYYSDGPVWIAPAVESYLMETGDNSFLAKKVPYFDGGEGTIWEHTYQSILSATDDIGPHGLVRAHYGDWNDSLNMLDLDGKGESNWTTIAMIFALKSAIGIAKNALKDDALVKDFEARIARLTKAINDTGWDGKWYLAGYNDLGDKVGSASCDEGKVYLNPQTWAILGDIIPEERKASVLSAIDDMLDTDYGSLVLTPSYTKRNSRIGRLTYFNPGMWENGSSYCHGSAFKIVADTFIRRGNMAYNTLMKILPDSKYNPSEKSGVPEYMVTNMYYGPENRRPGGVLYTWITGTADWVFKALSAYMIGVRATFEGLLIDPCVPTHWDKFGLTREFRGATYQVDIENPNGKETGVTSITVDGVPFEGTTLPVYGDGKLHIVKVVM